MKGHAEKTSEVEARSAKAGKQCLKPVMFTFRNFDFQVQHSQSIQVYVVMHAMLSYMQHEPCQRLSLMTLWFTVKANSTHCFMVHDS